MKKYHHCVKFTYPLSFQTNYSIIPFFESDKKSYSFPSLASCYYGNVHHQIGENE